MLYTSYFSFVQKIPPEFLVSVAGRAPAGFAGAEYRKLAPKYEWWRQWHDQKLADAWYIEKYYETVLSKLNPREVLRDLDGKIILCWETPEKFCHRHLVAEWLNKNAGASVLKLSAADRLAPLLPKGNVAFLFLC